MGVCEAAPVPSQESKNVCDEKGVAPVISHLIHQSDPHRNHTDPER